MHEAVQIIFLRIDRSSIGMGKRVFYLLLTLYYITTFPQKADTYLVSVSSNKEIGSNSHIVILPSRFPFSNKRFSSLTVLKNKGDKIDEDDSIKSEEDIENNIYQDKQYVPISKVVTAPRLPVWPIWSGLIIMFLDYIGLGKWGTILERNIGGRVSPMMFDVSSPISYLSDPMVLMVHHRHSFFAFDPVRVLQKFIFPEGFPAHPHRGFETVTYVLKGKMVHRDSFGTKQVYGDGSVQWLTAGSGMLHEEMWDIQFKKKLQNEFELYQIWINLPRKYKMVSPRIQTIGTDSPNSHEINTFIQEDISSECNGYTKVKVLAGSYKGCKSTINTYSEMNLFHIEMIPRPDTSGKEIDRVHYEVEWEYELPSSKEISVVLYVREGSLLVAQSLINESSGNGFTKPQLKWQEISQYETCIFKRNNDNISSFHSVRLKSGSSCDFMFFTAVPLRENIAASGTMVMNTNEEVKQAYLDYEQGKFGCLPWPHTLSDEEWKKHIHL